MMVISMIIMIMIISIIIIIIRMIITMTQVNVTEGETVMSCMEKLLQRRGFAPSNFQVFIIIMIMMIIWVLVNEDEKLSRLKGLAAAAADSKNKQGFKLCSENRFGNL